MYVEGSGVGLIKIFYQNLLVRGLRKTRRNLRQHSQCPCRELNWAPPEYKAVPLPLELTHSLFIF
jgi:hypothetical protein